jgi:hypothetical protein
MKRMVIVLTMAAMFVVLMAVFGGVSNAACPNGCKTTTTTAAFSPSGNANAKQNFTSTTTTIQQNSFYASKPNKQTTSSSCERPPGQCR